MKLLNNARIIFGGKVVTDEVLETYRNKWKRCNVAPGVGLDYSDENTFHRLLFGVAPFTIIGDEEAGDLDLEGSLKIFPYSIDGNRNFADYGLRLMPKHGRVKSIELDNEDGLGAAVNAFVVNGDGISVELGNGILRLEIFFRPIELQKEILPPAGFREEVVILQDVREAF